MTNFRNQKALLQKYYKDLVIKISNDVEPFTDGYDPATKSHIMSKSTPTRQADALLTDAMTNSEKCNELIKKLKKKGYIDSNENWYSNDNNTTNQCSSSEMDTIKSKSNIISNFFYKCQSNKAFFLKQTISCKYRILLQTHFLTTKWRNLANPLVYHQKK